jgi:hypothetical protein
VPKTAEIDMVAFAADVRTMSTNALAKKYAMTWTRANDHKAKIENSSDPQPETDEQNGEMVWPISIEIPAGRVKEMLSSFEPGEIMGALSESPEDRLADLVGLILQRRLKAILNGGAEQKASERDRDV